ncbi:MAG: DUF2971 domain-containing protein [Hyphomonadaceae bacterium]|nr:DUF2971 domain-containing protein [Hyphomonadaceae bacterium]
MTDDVHPTDEVQAGDIRAYAIFHPTAVRRQLAANGNDDLRFVHYTSSAAAIGILESKSVWMRNVSCMNDFMEVEHGLECLAQAYAGEHGDRLKTALDSIQSGICEEIQDLFNGWSPTFLRQTYVFCMSEHDANHEENNFGRLSMWRAYGRETRLALVLKKEPFLTPTDALNAYTSPVEYLSRDMFNDEFGKVVKGIIDNIGFVKTLGRDSLKGYLFQMFKFAALCTKHRGFQEEREWRVIYTHDLEPSKRLQMDVQIVGGSPQTIYKIPLKNAPEEGLIGIEAHEIVDRLIIGPTEYATATRDAFVHLLEKAGVENAPHKVVVSDIPLR